MFKYIALLCFAALALAQVNQPLTGVVTLASNTTVLSTLGPQLSSDDAYFLNFYSAFIPENATQVTLTLSSSTGDCSYYSVYGSSTNQPCSDDYWSDYFLCTKTYETGDDDVDTDFTPYSQNSIDFAVNQNWYFSVSKYYSSDYTYTCTYNIQLSWGECPAGQVAIQEGSSTYACSTYTYGNQTSNTFTYATAFTGDYAVYKIWVPDYNTNYIRVHINQTSDNTVYVYGANNFAPGDYSYENSLYNSGETDSFGNFKLPQQGWYYLTLDNTAYNSFTGYITIDVVPCAAGFSGNNCTSTLQALNLTQLISNGVNFTVPNIADVSVTYYVDVGPAFAGIASSLMLAATSDGTGYMYLRKNAAPIDSSAYYDFYVGTSSTGYIGVNYYDFAVPNRLFFGFDCDASTTCNVNLRVNGTIAGPVTTGTGATGGVTGATGGVTGATGGVTGSVTGGVTGQEDSSSFAAAIVAPVFALVFAVLAFF